MRQTKLEFRIASPILISVLTADTPNTVMLFGYSRFYKNLDTMTVRVLLRLCSANLSGFKNRCFKLTQSSFLMSNMNMDRYIIQFHSFSLSHVSKQ